MRGTHTPITDLEAPPFLHKGLSTCPQLCFVVGESVLIPAPPRRRADGVRAPETDGAGAEDRPDTMTELLTAHLLQKGDWVLDV